MITGSDVESARGPVAGRVRRTPLLALDAPFRGRGWFKLEYLQHPGTFTARGAFNRILRASENDSLDPSVRVVVASGGDAGMATRSRLANWGFGRRSSCPRPPRL